jgi:hypothetical protein
MKSHWIFLANFCTTPLSEVFMKSIIGLCALILVTTASANEIRCLNAEEATSAISENLESVRLELYKVSHRSVSRDVIRDYVSRIEFSETENTFRTAILAKWACAAGAECYAGIEVSCDGNVGVYTFSE